MGALRVGQHPGRRRGRGQGDVEIGRVVGIADRRPDHPAIGLDLVDDDGVAIVGLGEETAELVFGIILESGKQEFALVGDEDRLVVGDEFRAERAGMRRRKSRTTRTRACCE